MLPGDNFLGYSRLRGSDAQPRRAVDGAGLPACTVVLFLHVRVIDCNGRWASVAARSCGSISGDCLLVAVPKLPTSGAVVAEAGLRHIPRHGQGSPHASHRATAGRECTAGYIICGWVLRGEHTCIMLPCQRRRLCLVRSRHFSLGSIWLCILCA